MYNEAEEPIFCSCPQLSDMRAPSCGSSYFEFQLQTSPTKAMQAICYSPEKQPKIEKIQEKE